MPGTNDGAPLLHFDREEYEERRRRLLEAMASAELDAVLLFNQASLYWLTSTRSTRPDLTIHQPMKP